MSNLYNVINIHFGLNYYYIERSIHLAFVRY